MQAIDKFISKRQIIDKFSFKKTQVIDKFNLKIEATTYTLEVIVKSFLFCYRSCNRFYFIFINDNFHFPFVFIFIFIYEIVIELYQAFFMWAHDNISYIFFFNFLKLGLKRALTVIQP